VIFYSLFRSGDVVYIAHRHANSHGRFLELSEYGVRARRSFIVILEGHEGRGWSDCVEQMRKAINFLEPHGQVGSKEDKTHCGFSLLSRLVENGQRSYDQKIEDLGRKW
jgi:hypothetical protein